MGGTLPPTLECFFFFGGGFCLFVSVNGNNNYAPITVMSHPSRLVVGEGGFTAHADICVVLI